MMFSYDSSRKNTSVQECHVYIALGGIKKTISFGILPASYCGITMITVHRVLGL